jgi:hypothetical protein
MTIRALVVMIGLLAGSFGAQQRDATRPRVGTGEIAGVVLSADADPRPVRRVVVSIAGDMAEPRSVITDESGRFTFSRLPAGNFTIAGRKVTYLPVQFGATRPGGAGTAISLTAGEKRQISLTIFRGVVLAGTVRDDTGAPLADIPVAAVDVRVRPGNAPVQAPESVTTDDRGMFRFYGLPPGEYVVAAAPAPPGTGVIGARSAADLDALFSLLSDRQRQSLPAGRAAPAPPPALSIGYAPIYFPGTPVFSEASRVRAVAGDEKAGLNFVVTPIGVASIHGTVTGQTPSLSSVVLAIIPGAPRLSNMPGTFGITSTPPDDKGSSRGRAVAAGLIRVRHPRRTPASEWAAERRPRASSWNPWATRSMPRLTWTFAARM